jgi:hypothetical protein
MPVRREEEIQRRRGWQGTAYNYISLNIATANGYCEVDLKVCSKLNPTRELNLKMKS